MSDPDENPRRFTRPIPGLLLSQLPGGSAAHLDGWNPRESPLQRLVQFLDALAIGLNFTQFRTGFAARNLTATERASKIARIESVRADYASLVSAVLHPFPTPGMLRDAMSDETVAELVRAGSGDYSPVVQEGAGYLHELCYRLPHIHTLAQLEPDGRGAEVEQDLGEIGADDKAQLYRYDAYRSKLLQVLLVAGLTVPLAIRVRAWDVCHRRFRIEGEDESLDFTVLQGWVADAKPAKSTLDDEKEVKTNIREVSPLYKAIRDLRANSNTKTEVQIVAYVETPAGNQLREMIDEELMQRPQTRTNPPRPRTRKDVVRAALKDTYQGLKSQS